MKTRPCASLVFTLLFCAAVVSQATTYVWYGNYYVGNPYYNQFDTSWNNAVNWYPIGVPGPTDTAVITNYSSVVYLNNSISVSNIVLGVPDSCSNNSGIFLYIQNYNINLYGQLTVNPCSSFIFNSGVINGAGTNATFSGGVTMTGSGQISGTINIGPAGIFSIASGVDHNQPSFNLNNYGTVAWSAGRIRGGGLPGTLINNYGLWDSQGDLTFNADYALDGFVFNNFGTFRKSAGTGNTSFNAVSYNNSGVVDVEAGTLNLTAGGVFNGGSETGGGTLLLAGGGFALNGMTTTTNLQLSGGTLSGATVINGGFTWVVGNWNSAGSALLTSNSLLIITSANDHDLAYTTFTNLGTVTWAGPGRVRGGGVFGTQIYNYGLWDSQGDWTFNDDYGGDGTVFNNFGTLRKSAGTGNTALNPVYLVNTGTLDIESGTLLLTGGSWLAGGAQTGPGTLLMAGGGFTLSGMITTANAVLNGGLLYGDNVINGGLVWVVGDWINASSVTIASNSTVSVVSASDHNLGYINVTNYGTFAWSGPGRVRGGGVPGTQIYNYGLWDVQDDLTFNDDYGGDGTIFNNFGTFQKSAGTNTFATVSAGIYFVNNGLLNVEVGNLVMNGALANNGILNIVSGYVALDGGATLNGGTRTGAGLLQLGGGSFVVNGAQTGTNVQMTGGTLYGSNYLSGGMTWLGGTWSPGTSVTIPTNTVLNIGSAADHDMPGSILNNYGTVTWSGPGRVRGGGIPGTQIYNYGLWDAQGDWTLNDDFGGAGTVFNNFGTLRKSAGTGNTALNPVYLVNNGTLDIESGTLYLTAGASLAGGAQTGPGTLLMAGGGFTLSGMITTANAVLNGGLLYGDNVINGGLVWVVGDWNNARSVTIASNSTVSVVSASDHNLGYINVTNYGTFAWSGPGRVRGGGIPGTQIFNYGLWDAQGDWTFNDDFAGAGTVFDNFGTFRKSAGTNTATTVSAGINFTSTGLMDVQMGNLVMNGALASTGTINIVSGYVALDGGATLNGGAQTGAGLLQLAAGSFNVNGMTTTTNLQMTGGTLYGTNLFTSGLYWFGGNWDSASSVTIPTNTVLNVLSGADHDLASCTLNNYGTVTWTGGRLRGGGNPATVYNNFGAWDSQADLTFNSDLGLNGYVFNNFGTFLKSGGTGNTTFGAGATAPNFKSSGLLNVPTGSVVFNGGGTFSAGSVTGNGFAYLSAGNFSIKNTTTTTNVIEAGGNLAGMNVINGGFIWNNGNWDSASSVTILSNSLVDAVSTADHDLANCTVSNYGTFNWVAGRLRGGGNPGTIVQNFGLWDAQSDYAFNSDLGLNGFVFNNLGTFRKSGGSSGTTFSPSGGASTFNNRGTVLNLTPVPVYLNGGGVFSAGSISGLAVLGGGYFNINGTVTSTNVQETASYLYGSNVLSGGFIWSGGNWDSASSVTVAAGTELDIASAADHDLASCTFNNLGRVEWLGGRIRGGGNPGTVINNNATWEVQCDYALNSDLGLNGIAFNNGGKFRKFNTTGTTTWLASSGVATFNDFGGTVELDSGTLSFPANFYTPAAGMTFGLGGTNSGQFGRLVAGGAAFIGGPMTVILLNNFQPAKPEQFTIVSSVLDSGAFSTATLPAGLAVNYTNNAVYLTATGSAALQILSKLSGTNLLFSFPTVLNQGYTVQLTTNLTTGNWINWMSVVGDGTTPQYSIPITNTVPELFLRIREP